MKYHLALVLLTALPLVACGGEAEEQQEAAINQLEAADNVMWNDLADISLENQASLAPPPAADAETATEQRPSSKSEPAPTARSRSEPTDRDPSPAPEAKPAPAPEAEPSTQPQESCTPEHRAAGHC